MQIIIHHKGLKFVGKRGPTLDAAQFEAAIADCKEGLSSGLRAFSQDLANGDTLVMAPMAVQDSVFIFTNGKAAKPLKRGTRRVRGKKVLALK